MRQSITGHDERRYALIVRIVGISPRADSRASRLAI
jgi:hypothetical protein